MSFPDSGKRVGEVICILFFFQIRNSLSKLLGMKGICKSIYELINPKSSKSSFSVDLRGNPKEKGVRLN